MPTLYELTPQYKAAQKALENADLSTIDEVLQILEEVDDEYSSKMEAYCRIIRNMEARQTVFEQEAASLKAEMEYWTAKKKTLANTIERLEERMKQSMEALGLIKVEAGPFTPSIEANGGKPVVRFIGDDIKKLPKKFKKIIPAETVLDTNAVIAAQKAGESIPGTISIERGSHLKIR